MRGFALDRFLLACCFNLQQGLRWIILTFLLSLVLLFTNIAFPSADEHSYVLMYLLLYRTMYLIFGETIKLTVIFLVEHEKQYLLVLNNGEDALTLKVNVSSANETYENIQIPRHDFKQVENSSFLNGWL